MQISGIKNWWILSLSRNFLLVIFPDQSCSPDDYKFHNVFRNSKAHSSLCALFTPENVRDFVDSLLLTQKEAKAAGEEEEANRLTDTHLAQTVFDIFSGMKIIQLLFPLYSHRARAVGFQLFR